MDQILYNLYMDYPEFHALMHQHVVEGEKRLLLQQIADHPDRYQILFSVNPPKSRLLQVMLTLRENRFAEALRVLIKQLLLEIGYSILPGRIQDAEGNDLAVDPHFAGGKAYYFLDQRLRDDMDAIQRTNLVRNFSHRLDALHRLHGDRLVGILYFLDPNQVKQRSYFTEALAQLRREYSTELHLFYGPEFFAYLGQPSMWVDLVGSLIEWKKGIEEFPLPDFDSDPQSSFAELRSLDHRFWWNLVIEDSLWENNIMQTLFRNGETLALLRDYFSEQNTAPFPLLTRALASRLEKFYRLKPQG